MKKTLTALLFTFVLGVSAFAQNAVELVTVKGSQTRTGLGLPVFKVDDVSQLSVWLLSDTRLFADNLNDGNSLYLGLGASRALWATSDKKFSLNATGGWSANFNEVKSPKNAEWALGVSLGIKF